MNALRRAARPLTRSPAFAAALLLMLGLGAGLAAAGFSLADGGLRHPAPLEAPEGLELPAPEAGLASATGMTVAPAGGGVMGGERARTSRGLQSIARLQEEGLDTLLGTAAGAAALALAIACGNLALLLLARGAARRHELAVRRAVGASRWRVERQLLAEASVLLALGALLGVAIGAAGIAVLRAGWPAGLATWLHGPLPVRAAALGLGPPLLTALLFSLAPARMLRESELHPVLSGGARATASRREGWMRSRLTVLAVAGSVTLLTGAGLLLRSFGSVQAAPDPGLDPRDTVTLQVQPPAALRMDPPARAAYYEALLRRVEAIPGVVAGSVSSEGAWMGLGTSDLVHSITGIPTRPGILQPARHHAVSPGFFRAHGIPVLQGREFTAADRPGTGAVAVVSRTFAFRLFPGVDPVGRHVQLGRLKLRGTWYTVVGVVGDVRPAGIGTSEQPAPSIYLSALQVPPRTVGLAVRTAGDPLAVVPAVRRAVRAAAPAARAGAPATLEERLARFRAPLGWFAGVFAALACFSVALAASGVYGVIAYNVARRTREVGIRMALGAPARSVVGMFVRQGARLAARGLALGLLGALCVARLLQYVFRGVDPLDPLVYGSIVLLLGALALLASFAPARRAARLDPVHALREE